MPSRFVYTHLQCSHKDEIDYQCISQNDSLSLTCDYIRNKRAWMGDSTMNRGGRFTVAGGTHSESYPVSCWEMGQEAGETDLDGCW